MRLVTATVTYLTLIASPASANEAFIAQSANQPVATGQSPVHSARAMLSAAMLAFPLQPKPVNSPVANPATAAANTSSVIQIGANNVAAVSQTGSGNASTLMQHGSGNQATVTQRR